MGSSRIFAVVVTLFIGFASRSEAQIYVAESAASPSVSKRVRVSVKIMNDAQGRRPADGYYHTDEQILAVFDDCNATLSAMNADWRLELVEILDVRGASEWFGPFDCDLKREFEAYARTYASRYYYRTNAINFYVISELSGCGGYCSIPSSGDEIIIINNRIGILNWSLGWLHEIGHYFGLQHTYQCPNRPCESFHNQCTGAGSEMRDCPDVCPDSRNIMGGYDDLTVGGAIFSPCQLSELALSMRDGNGIRSKVVEQVVPEAQSSVTCTPSTVGAGSAGASAAAGTPVVLAVLPRAPSEPVQGGTQTNNGATPASCDGDADVTPPEVLRIDPQFAANSLRVNGVVIQFSEAIKTTEVQNGVDIAITLERTQLDGTIAWRDNDKTLAWTARQAMPAGQYGIFLTGQDKTDFQDMSGNVLQANTDGYFAVGFALDSNSQLLLPSSTACGAGGFFAGMMLLPMAIAARGRSRRRG
ncbi:MAG: Ig-like domain-containing protein [Phycisphaerales bacterium]|nr:Ig-like domain-containing protein [Phycisphaerales bacterium]